VESATAKQWRYLSTDGEELVLLTNSDAGADSSCASLTLDLTGQELLWAGILAESAAVAGEGNGFLLQGDFSDGESVTVSEIVGLGNPTPTEDEPVESTARTLRYGENLLNISQQLVFGEEERVIWTAEQALDCKAGERPAGVQLFGAGSWPNSQGALLFIEASGNGVFQFAVADETRIETEAPLILGNYSYASDTHSEPVLLELPATDSAWQALTFSCPEDAASLHIDRVVVVPEVSRSPRSYLSSDRKRAAWLWSPSLWQDRRMQESLLWKIVSENALNEVYISIPVAADGAIDRVQLNAFTATAEQQGVDVWPVIGDRRDVLRESREALENRITAYARFNGDASTQNKLGGVQLDIEPYLLSGFSLNPAYWAERYIETIAFARASVGPFLNIDLVVPVWWGSHPELGSAFLEKLAPFQTSITIMNYRTDVLELINGARPFLNWGEIHNRKVSIGLEAGTIVDEQQQLYRPGESAGELWQLEIAGRKVLALFSSSAEDLPGNPYQQYLQRIYSGGNISFRGDLDRLTVVADFLQRSFADIPAFRGISLHGLDEIYREQDRE